MGRCKFLSLFLLIALTAAAPQNSNKVDALIGKFSNAQPDSLVSILKKILYESSKLDSTTAANYLSKTVRITSQYSSRDRNSAAVLSRIYCAYFVPPGEKLVLLRDAFIRAKNYKDYILMAFSKTAISEVHRSRLEFDSSMICLLEAKQYYDQSGFLNGKVVMIHSIGDFYFHANLFDKAEQYYKQVLQLKGEPHGWRTFRYVVINNNFGEIEIKRGNYKSAESYFNKTLDYINSYTGGKLAHDDSVRLAYTYSLLAKVGYLQKNYPLAEKHYRSSLFFTKSTKWRVTLPTLYNVKSNLLLNKNQYDSAFIYLKKAYAENKILNEPENAVEISKSFANAYQKINDYKNAFLWNMRYEHVKDSIASKINSAAYLQLKAEKENEANLSTINNLEHEEKILLGTIASITISFLVILFMLIRLRKADKKLIQKSIEIVGIEDEHKLLNAEAIMESQPEENFLTGKDEAEVSDSTSEPEPPNVQLIHLSAKLEKLMNEEKVYLNPEITIDEVAARLNSNRTYVSKAIRLFHNSNFMTYINDYRIKEAVRIISNKKSSMYSLEGLGKEVGFNNRITFTSAFKKYTGVTPSFFTKNLSSSRKEEE